MLCPARVFAQVSSTSRQSRQDSAVRSVDYKAEACVAQLPSLLKNSFKRVQGRILQPARDYLC